MRDNKEKGKKMGMEMVDPVSLSFFGNNHSNWLLTTKAVFIAFFALHFYLQRLPQNDTVKTERMFGNL